MLIVTAAHCSLGEAKVSSKAPMPAIVREGHTFRVSKIYWIGVGRSESSYLFCPYALRHTAAVKLLAGA